MLSIYEQRGEVEAYVLNLVADTKADVAKLIIEYDTAAPGSTCLCLEDSSVWMFGADSKWVEI